jgi:hypothetical protein
VVQHHDVVEFGRVRTHPVEITRITRHVCRLLIVLRKD